MADLEVEAWGPGGVTPGQTLNYTLEVRNAGVKSAEDVVVIDMLPGEVAYVSSSSKGIYKPGTHEVIWKLGSMAAKSKTLLSAKGKVEWGLSTGTRFTNAAPRFLIDDGKEGM